MRVARDAERQVAAASVALFTDLVELRAAGEVDLAGLLAGGGVEDGAGAAGAAGGRGAVGPVGDAGGHAAENIDLPLSGAMLSLLCYKTCGRTLVEAVDDRSAKGIALALSAGDRPRRRCGPASGCRRSAGSPATSRSHRPPSAPPGPSWPAPGSSRPTVVAAPGSARPRSGRAATGGPSTRRPATGSTSRPACPTPAAARPARGDAAGPARRDTPTPTSRSRSYPRCARSSRTSWPNPAEALTVVDGAMDAHSQFVAAHLRFGDRVAVEQPCFPPLLDLLEMAGVVPLGVGVRRRGARRRRRRAALDAGAKVLFFQPWGQNPSGQSVSTARARGQLAAALAGRDVVVVEDDSAGGTPSGPPVSLGAFLPERTVLVRSFSKTHGPDLRLAAIGGPADGRRADRRAALPRPGLEQPAGAVDPAGAADRPRARGELVADAQATYAARTAAMADALRRRGVDVPGRDGINVWVPVAEQGAALLHLAAAGDPGRQRRPVLDLRRPAPTTSGSPPRPSTTTTGPTSPTSPSSPTWSTDAARAGTWSGQR